MFSKIKRKFKSEEFKIKFFTLIILISLTIFLILSIFLKSKEFIYYIIILLAAVIISYLVHKKLHLHLAILTLIWVAFILHALGGTVYFGANRLYDMVFLGFIKYDNIVHFFMSFIVVFMAYNLIHPRFKTNKKHTKFWLGFFIILITAGVGTIAEMIELIAVIFFDAAKGVGGYMNNAIDLVVNFIGAIVGAIIILKYHNKKFLKKTLLKP